MRDRAVKEVVSSLRILAHVMIQRGARLEAKGVAQAAEILRRKMDTERNNRERKKYLGRAFVSVKKAAEAEVKENS